MRILVTGKEGQLGWELSRALQTFGQVIPLGRLQMNLENPDTIRAVVREVRPGLIVNAAAYTAVDQAEAEPERAFAVISTGPGIIAEEAKRIGAGLVHYSTDYVFNGTKPTPYIETDPVAPCNVYGQSKLGGEQAVAAAGAPHLILRTSWVYGARGGDFLQTILRLARERDELRIVTDQVGAPTWSRLVAMATAHILATRQPLPTANGLYHLTSSGHTSWYGFTQAIFKWLPDSAKPQNPSGPRLRPVTTDAYPTAARRPANSQLCCDKLRQDFEISLPDWEHMLRLCLKG